MKSSNNKYNISDTFHLLTSMNIQSILSMMDKSMENLKKGIASKPVDIDKYLKLVEKANEI